MLEQDCVPYRVECDLAVDLQLLIQVLAIAAHPFAEVEAAIDVGRVQKVAHIQHAALVGGGLVAVLQQLQESTGTCNQSNAYQDLLESGLKCLIPPRLFWY